MHTREEWLVDRHEYCICVERDGEPLDIATLAPVDHNGIKHVIGDETCRNDYLMSSATQLLQALEALEAMRVKALKQKWNNQHPDLVDEAKMVIKLTKPGYPSVFNGDEELI